MKTKFYNCKADSGAFLSVIAIRTRRLLGITCLLVMSYCSGISQTSSFSFTQIPVSNTDILAPGRGSEHWGSTDWDGIYAPLVPLGNSKPLNYYDRFNWTDIESTTTQGSYNWTIFDTRINKAIDDGAMFSFGIMTMCTSCGLPGFGYPTYLHNLMQAETANSRDWQNSGGDWVPNWNSPNFLGRFEALLNAFAAHINSTSYKGKNYKDVIYYVDVRGYGDFGEWHTYPWTGTEPTGRLATVATLQRILDAHKTAFPNYPLMIPMGAFDTQNSSQLPAQFCYYALTTTNNWGQIGWRRDNYGDDGYNDWLYANPGTYDPGTGAVAFSTLIMNKWKYAPIGGEPANDLNGISRCGSPQCDLLNEVNMFHVSHIGNGNYPILITTLLGNNVVAASKAMGYRLILTGGSMPTTLSTGNAFNVSLNWQNIGVAPTYENWNVVYELRNSAGTAVWSGTSAFKPKLFLPQASSTASSDNFTLSSVPAGTYSLYMIVKDPANYKAPLPLAITGRNADGSYLLRSNITVATGTGTGNQPPTANAGIDQTIQLPTSTTSLTGSGNDPDGSIASYAWAKVSGPAGGTIASPGSANTNITGLAQGSYVYSLTVTDNLGATGTANVQVTVNPAGGSSFVISAGPDQTLAAGATTTTLSGTLPVTVSDTVNLIVIQGESNAAGNAPNVDALPSELVSRSTVKIFNHATGKFENLQVGVNNEQDTYIDATHHGLELGLANQVDSNHYSNPAYLVKIGVSGSYISQWMPGSTARAPLPGLWEDDMPFVDDAVAAMKASGLKFRIIVWQSIGLNDRFGQATNVDSFQARMQRYRTFFRQRYNNNNIHFLSTNFDNPPASSFDWAYVWPKMAAADPLFHEIDVHGATYMDGGSHFDHDGFKLISKRMVDATVAITGGTGTGGSTYTIVWSKLSGPAGGTIVSPNSASTSITGLVPGTYVYRLSVTDNLGTTVTDDVQITVPAGNQPPVANAGTDINITLPVNSTTLNGTASADPDGTIATYTWTKISGPTQFIIANTAASSTGLSNLVQGVYSFRLRVTDNAGATALDTVKVTVNAAPPGNLPPVANAGGDIDLVLPVNSTTLDGTTSSDPDGTIATYAWTKISGPAQFTIANAAAASTGLSNLVQGVYTFRLQVLDNGGATASDTVIVTVDVAPPPANQPPIANAGTDISITLPVNTTILNGTGSSDPDGTIASYAWTKISGPAQFSIASPAASSTALNNLAQGVYLFRLRVTDNSGARTSDTIKVTVNPAPNQPPVANAGANITITLPVNSTTLDGGASSDADGTITTYAWTKVSGPTQFTIANAAGVSTGLSNLVAGTYVFRLTVTDNSGANATATVTVTVNAAPPPGNQPPIANAGADITITLPTNVALLTGSGSSDPDGTIATYAWTKISGPTQFSIANPGSANTGISNLVQGVYVFRLQVLDNGGATASATVTVTVNAAPPPGNIAPTANAGTDITITVPANTTNLDGSASSDPDGAIAAYSWNKISGPGAITIVNSNTATPSVVGLQVGQYVFELTVTDNSGATGKDRVTVLVNDAANAAPIADAGKDTTITLPSSIAVLKGAGSKDPDGTIAKYVWKQLSGPATAAIANAGASTTQVGALATEGDYVFELDVTDNAGAVSVATVKVTVINTFRFTQSFKIYPNPAVVTLNIEFIDDNNGKIKILVFDAAGRQVINDEYTKSGSTFTKQINVDRLKAGTYFMQLVQTDGTKLIRPFVKQ